MSNDGADPVQCCPRCVARFCFAAKICRRSRFSGVWRWLRRAGSRQRGRCNCTGHALGRGARGCLGCARCRRAWRFGAAGFTAWGGVGFRGYLGYRRWPGIFPCDRVNPGDSIRLGVSYFVGNRLRVCFRSWWGRFFGYHDACSGDWVDEVLCSAMRTAEVTPAYNDRAGRLLPPDVETSRCVNVL